jgi:hypothetical protein
MSLDLQLMEVQPGVWIKCKPSCAAFSSDPAPLYLIVHNVPQILTEPDGYDEKDPENKDPVRGLRASARQIVEASSETDEHGELKIKAGYEIASLLGRFTRKSKELASVPSTADTQARWLLSKRIRRNLNKAGSINCQDVRDTLTTVFVILPAERMRTHSVWLQIAAHIGNSRLLAGASYPREPLQALLSLFRYLRRPK